VTPLIDGGHYPTTKIGGAHIRAFFSSQARTANQYLDAVPYFLIRLEPGMAVAIPSGAYHAPLATSHDSVSVNSFLAPSLLKRSFPSLRTGNFLSKDGIGRYLGSWLGYYVKWFGYVPSAVRFGSYEYY